MSYLRVLVFTFLFMIIGSVQAQDFERGGSQFNIYLTKEFGASNSQPLKYGMRFDYSHRDHQLGSILDTDQRPALVDFQFSSRGLVDFKASGISALQPTYFLGADEGGFLGNINWTLVGYALFGVAVFTVAEDDKEERLERIAETNPRDGEGGEEAGGEGAGGEEEGGEEPVLGCDPALGTGQCL